MPSQTQPLFLSPALPTELLWHIIHHCTFPSTLIVCSSRAEFLSSVAQQLRQQQDTELEEPSAGEPESAQGQSQHLGTTSTRTTQLLAAPLYQVAVARHIRVAFIPTVSHLRAFLSVLSVDGAKVSAPPLSAHGGATASVGAPLLLIYGFLDLHRDTSEWSAQGISNTSAVLVETARRVGLQPVVAEQKTGEIGTDEILAEHIPVLSGSARRIGPDFESGGWTGRTVDVRRVLGRWFRLQPGDWNREESHNIS